MDIRVQSDPFDAGAELNRFSADLNNMGAVVSFTGVVRNSPRAELHHMEIEHYPGMTEKALTKIATDASKRWDLGNVLIIHRHGILKPNDTIMMIATCSPHRSDAFQAADFLMDYLKSRAPFWKREVTAAGANWVDAKDVDEDALGRWD